MTQTLSPQVPAVDRCVAGPLHVVSVTRPEHRELYLSAAAPLGCAASARADVTEIYGAIVPLLAEQNAVVVQERLFGPLAVREAAEAARDAAVAGSPAFSALPPTYLEGKPACGDGFSGVHLCAVAGGREAPILHGHRTAGRLIRTPSATYVYLGGLRGTTPDAPLSPVDQATRMFDTANELLENLGCRYRDVVRTWIYIGDILAWYDDFNQARNECYARYGLLGQGDDYLPASTGIQARPPGCLALTMDLLAVHPNADSDVLADRLHNPLQNEAYAYGSAFARAMEVVTGGARTVYVSGTASIDEFGMSIHQDDIEAQIVRTMKNIDALIGTRGLGLQDICQASIFLKSADYIEPFYTLCAGTPFADLGVCVVADVCRDDLLFEIDAVAAGTA
jgi:enamine deaminase RidA (YjgF/YER057c/UK114 family)